MMSVCLPVFAIMIVDACLAQGRHYYDRHCLYSALGQRTLWNKVCSTNRHDTLQFPAAAKRPLLYMMSQATPSLYCVQDTRAHTWRVQTVPVEPGSFQSRKPLPKAWMGLRDKELDAESGISGCVFVHASGFIGGNKTYEGTLEMAKQGLALP